MKKETWVEILVVVVILGGLGFLSVRVLDISQVLGSVDAKVSLTSDRVDRIAQALPDVGVRVAYEEIRKPIRTIVLTSTPVEQPDGALESTVSVIDLAENRTWTRPVRLASYNDKRVIGALAWAGAEVDPQYASVARMQEYAQTTKSDTPIPLFINPSTSFVLRTVSGEQFLKQASWFEAVPSEKTVGLNGDNWQVLANSLKQSESQLAPKE